MVPYDDLQYIASADYVWLRDRRKEVDLTLLLLETFRPISLYECEVEFGDRNLRRSSSYVHDLICRLAC